MTEEKSPQMSPQDERVMAGISHISALIPMMGLFAPIIIWVTQKDKSEYVAFQSLQALAYQLSMILAYFIGWGCYMFSFFGIFTAIPFMPPEGSTSPGSPLVMIPMILPFIVMGGIFLCGFLLIVYGIIGAVQTFQGKPFRYLLIGKWVERYLEGKPGGNNPAEA